MARRSRESPPAVPAAVAVADGLGDALPAIFYARDALDVAHDVLGMHVTAGGVTLRITEVEAYRGPTDTAAHARFGKTARTATLFGPVGHAYVYLCYGLHWMLNFVTTGDGSAVLVRAAEPVHGLEVVRARRGGKEGPVLLTGPGKIGQALGLDRSHDGVPLFDPRGAVVVSAAPRPREVLHGPRVGIDYAESQHRDAPWRVAVSGTRWLTVPRTLEIYGKSRPPR